MDEIAAIANQKRAERQALLKKKQEDIERAKCAMDNKIRALALLEQELDGMDEDKEDYFERLGWVDKGGNGENNNGENNNGENDNGENDSEP